MNDANVPSEECSVVVLYGINDEMKTASTFYHTVVRWAVELGFPPDKLSVHGPGHSGKVASFTRLDAKLQKTGFEGVKNLSITAMIPGGQIAVMDWLLTADWSVDPSYALVATRSSIATLSSESMLTLAQKLVLNSKPEYGAGYKRAHRLGPAMFAVGICQGLGTDGYGVNLSEVEKQEAERISRWSDGLTERVWRQGVMRDVFLWNLLTDTHLAKTVGGMPLAQWIGQDATRGVIRSLCDGVYEWQVEEANLRNIRRSLHQAGIIFDFNIHI